MPADAILSLLCTHERDAIVQAVELLHAADDPALVEDVLRHFRSDRHSWPQRVSLWLLGSLTSHIDGLTSPRQVTLDHHESAHLWCLTAPHLHLFSLKICALPGQDVVLPDCPAMRSLVTLHVKGAQSLTLAPAMTILRTLHLDQCTKLKRLDGLEQAPQLENLILRRCPALEVVGDVSTLGQLGGLDVRGCPALQRVDGLDNHPSLKTLHLARTTLCAQRLPGLRSLTLSRVLDKPTPDRIVDWSARKWIRKDACAGFPRLQKLAICDGDVASLEGLPPGLTHLSLRNVYIGDFRGLSALPPLQHLAISARTFSGQSLAGLEGQTGLRKLELRQSALLRDISALSGLPLLSLRLTKLRELTELAPLQTLPVLRTLDLRWLKGSGRPDESSPDMDVCQLTSLRHLFLHRCGRLGELSNIQQLTHLETLSVDGCRNLKRWGDLRALPLRKLDTRRCFWAGENARIASGPDAAVLAGALMAAEAERLRDARSASAWEQRAETEKGACTRMLIVGQQHPGMPQLASAAHLRELTIQSVRRSWRWPEQGPVPSLTHLILRGCYGFSLNGLASFAPNLQRLDLITVSPKRLHPLQQCRHLDTVRILHDRSVGAETGLASLEGVTHLGLLGRNLFLRNGVWPPGVDTLEIVQPAGFMMQDALRSGDQVRHLLLRGCGTLRTLDPIQHLRNLRSVTLHKSNIRCAAAIVQHQTLQRADLRESLLPEPLRNNWDGPQQIDILRELLRALKRRG